MSIYIHIPFCSSICTYCDFCKVYYDTKYIDAYLTNLHKEIKSRYHNEEVGTIYIGGGTPTSLKDAEFERLLAMTKIFNIGPSPEFTVESNIEDLTESKLKIMRKYGVNRLSIGIQSFNAKIIRKLGRHHTREEVLEKMNLVKKYFTNINIDLIYAAYNNMSILKEDVKTVLSLNVPHISAYSLIIEDGTILKINGFQNIPEDTDYQMYKYIEKTLEKSGYHHYEISNYAKENFECQHNLTYWLNADYYGFGLSSTSYLNGVRSENTKSLTQYLKGIYLKEENYEDQRQQMENEVMLALRLIDGLDLTKFKEKYHIPFEDVFNISSLVDDGYLVKEDNHLKINKKYLYISNEILLRILS